MFGYVKVKKEELLVKDWILYKAVYCGLCREMKKNVSFFLSFGLSYDFVFLAIARDMLEGGEISVKKGRCPYNPFNRRAFVHSKGIEFAARAALILSEKNLDDKRRDRDFGILSPFLGIAQHHLKRRERKALDNGVYNELHRNVEEAFEKYCKLENETTDSDTIATGFGDVLAAVVSTGLEGDKKRISESLGRSIGAWLYLADAVDDIDRDYKKGKFNPLISLYSTPENVRSHFKEIDVSFGGWARDAHLALSLISNDDFGRISDNILTHGLGQEAYDIMNKRRSK